MPNPSMTPSAATHFVDVLAAELVLRVVIWFRGISNGYELRADLLALCRDVEKGRPPRGVRNTGLLPYRSDAGGCQAARLFFN